MVRTIEVSGEQWAIEERARIGAMTIRPNEHDPRRYVSILTCRSSQGAVVSTAAPADQWYAMPETDLARRIEAALSLRGKR
jgi:hypothetical protein